MSVGGSGMCCYLKSRIIPNPDGSIANDLNFDHGRRRTKPKYYYWSPIVHFVVRCITASCSSTDTRRSCTVPSLDAAGRSVARAS